MRNAILPFGLLGALIITGCVQEKSFEVTGSVPSSQMRESATVQRERPHTSPQPTFPTAQRVPPPPPQAYSAPVQRTPVRETAATTPPVSTTVSAPATKVTITPDTALIGKVVSVNASLRFVVLNFPVGRMASIDRQFGLYRQGQKIGSVKITGPQQDDNIIADISEGDAQAGDEVREN